MSSARQVRARLFIASDSTCPKGRGVITMGVGTVPAHPLETVLPELPEVEITRRHLESALLGKVFERVDVTHDRTARHNASPAEVETRLRGRRVTAVGRRGKFLEIGLDDGQMMVAHLGMSGRWTVDGEAGIPHTHFTAVLDDGSTVRFIDPRTFGFVAVYDEDELATSGVGRLGPDAWENPPDAGCSGRHAEREDRADQGTSARSGPDRRSRQHLCRRGPVSRRHPPADPRWGDHRDPVGEAAGRGARGARHRHSVMGAPPSTISPIYSRTGGPATT